MFKFVSKALLPLVMDKKARQKLQALRDSKNDSPPDAPPPDKQTPRRRKTGNDT